MSEQHPTLHRDFQDKQYMDLYRCYVIEGGVFCKSLELDEAGNAFGSDPHDGLRL